MYRSQYLTLLAFLGIFNSCQEKNPINFPDYFPQENRRLFDTVTQESIELGKELFLDPRLSSNNKISCSSCHLKELAFTDGKILGVGILGRNSRHNSSTLLNVGFNTSFMFDMRAHSLEIQPIVPFTDTNEMNVTIQELELKFKNDSHYQSMSQKVWGTPLNGYAILRSLAAFMKTLISKTSLYDRFIESKDSSIFNSEQRKGMNLFFGKANCNDCHTAPLFTNHLHYNLNLEDSLTGDIGKMGATHDLRDRGRFKTPSLRNIEITQPYFHDGRAETIESGVDEHISASRNSYDYCPPNLTNKEKKHLIAFLKTLTDANYKKTSSLRTK